MKDQTLDYKKIVARAMDAWDRGFNRAESIWRVGDRTSSRSYYWGKWEVGRMEAILACREDFPVLAAALWGIPADYTHDILYDVQSILDDGFPVWQIQTEDDLRLLDEEATSRGWCGLWRNQARPALHRYMGLFTS